jgi:hypothetical protein
VRLEAGTSRFLIGLLTCLATHDAIPAVARRLAHIQARRQIYPYRFIREMQRP